MPHCSACHQEKQKQEFTKSQIRKKESKRCKDCVQLSIHTTRSGAPDIQQPRSVQSNHTTQNGAPNIQQPPSVSTWRSLGRRYKDATGRFVSSLLQFLNVPVKASLEDNNSGSKKHGRKQGGTPKQVKKQALEVHCGTCNQTCRAAKKHLAHMKWYPVQYQECLDCWNKPSNRPCMDCDTVCLATNSDKEKQMYRCNSCKLKKIFAQKGVAYESLSERCGLNLDDNLDDKSFDVEPGKYQVVFYESLNIDCCSYEEEEEHCHRTAKGTFEVFSNASEGILGQLHIETTLATMEEGAVLKYTMKELTTDDQKSAASRCYNGTNCFSKGKAKRCFLIDRNGSHQSLADWEWIEKLDPDECEYYDHSYCGGLLRRVTKRFFLALDYDRPLGCDDVLAPTPTSVTQEEAEQQLRAYHKFSNASSWLHEHLKLPPLSCGLIRQFLTPPPFLAIEPGDLVMHIEEPVNPEFDRMVVLRKQQS